MNLAIKGHRTRGGEVVQLLEMLGGVNKYQIGAIRETYVYFVDIDGIVRSLQINQLLPEQYIVYSLEEFEEKFPYKVGDKVSSKYLKNYKIEKIKWKGTSNRVIYKLQGMGWYSADELQPYKEETMEEKEPEPKAPILSNRYDYAEGKCGYVIPDGYEFDYIKEGFQTEIILKPKKPTYPKTYEECCNVLMGKTDFQDFSLVLTKLSTNINEENSISPEPPYITSINNLYKLLICRDAYWKIAGKELGLDKSWKPDWDNLSTTHESIKINKGCFTYSSRVLVFPTPEMRNAFYENFKELIQECKE